MTDPIKACRICGNDNLVKILDLGVQKLTGTFPRHPDPVLTEGPLVLVKCYGEDVCGLVQLDRSYDLGEMYGENYGYRSGLNQSMVEHLRGKVTRVTELNLLQPGDLVIDIGSNDGTTLGFYEPAGLTLVGVDPTAEKFRKYYPDHVSIIPDFFTASLIRNRLPGRKARVVTSFSMFYDLEDPLAFMREIEGILEDNGIWVFEQSYLPTMLARNSYDTVCHEHIEFYALEQIHWMAQRAGLAIRDVEFNDVNGGSFSVTVGKATGAALPAKIVELLEDEKRNGIPTLDVYREFEHRTERLRAELRTFIETAKRDGKVVAALGASTKGNVLLQYCNLGPDTIPAVGEVNPDKYGCLTPGTWIPIVSQDELLQQKPDYLLVLPWHFRDFFVRSRQLSEFTLLFPLPELEVVPPRA
ncbi:class I SAM-dependent methyltransferase [Sphingomonas sp. LaA6.9]|uniref:class I SAM-dependent methyltransferase n=1 Tax=Sphingomonas sp. LaA6.9 TaxID=2919914 RepID=UPI001F4F3EE4|nr:class I SAM-dependent methyltransferase [Sphingomonas sp. LaA6.9]MCJ8159699.1 class I SAM-dependent methyltransferase [Sphingomonas sp. LaA6.9]